MFCHKFGWNDFRTALWLRRRDPDRQHGAVCFWFYIASALWRVCLWSFALMFVIAVLFAIPEALQAAKGVRQNPAAEPPAEIVTFMTVWMVSSASASFYTTLAVWFAWRSGRKVWISGSVSESRRRGEWPPRLRTRRKRQSNLLRWWLFATGIVAVAGFLAVIEIIGVRKALPGNGQDGTHLLGIVFGAGACLSFVLGSRIYDRLGAFNAEECWPHPDDDAVANPYD